ncbi:hypothetical protein TSH7_33045 [Azospirillum sp. TSH7]|nr:hypothetical protein TSH7_33045 [Azospirillum sp. TSH7]PWC55062.1 hypothetical protein TSH20_33540 [Azospirillum sp. TSH20]
MLDDRGFRQVDPPPATTFSVAIQHVIAKGLAARHPAGHGTAELAAAGLVRQVFQGDLRHHAHDGDVDGGDFAELRGEQPDAVEGEAVLKVGGVGEATAEPVDRFAQHDVEAALSGLAQQLLEGRTVTAGAAEGGITVMVDDSPALALGIAPADLDLVGNGGFALLVAGIAGVDDGAHDGDPTGARRGQCGAGG